MPRPYIGGQAVLEGVFLRAPRSLAVAVRIPDGSIRVRSDPWMPLYQRLKFARWPFIRGIFLLWESLRLGWSALSWSGEQAVPPEASPKPSGTEARKGTAGEKAAMGGTLVVSVLLGLALFVALPHLATDWGSRISGVPLDVERPAFHLVDGVIKLAVFLAYIALIRRSRDIRRVFEYHGAEHKTIYAWEDGLPLTVDAVRTRSRFHPRCGTSFLIIVVAVSILVFAAAFPLLPRITLEPRFLRNLVQVAVKLPLLLPVASVSYELLRLSSRFFHLAPARWLAAPGLALQRLTTDEPDDEQIEVALAALHAALAVEASAPGDVLGIEGEAFRTGASAIARPFHILPRVPVPPPCSSA
ncbi:MAG: DUF1385 domain-containing protein [Deltaproteobacteria bacterium]|nr:DUF1385 domain-containing protein [Deltaproteobacteria bacterium]